MYSTNFSFHSAIHSKLSKLNYVNFDPHLYWLFTKHVITVVTPLYSRDSLFESRLQHRISWEFLWLFSVPSCKFRGNTSRRLLWFPSRSFPFHHSSIILKFDAKFTGQSRKISKNYIDQVNICIVNYRCIIGILCTWAAPDGSFLEIPCRPRDVQSIAVSGAPQLHPFSLTEAECPWCLSWHQESGSIQNKFSFWTN
jgi:hypothetical protein